MIEDRDYDLGEVCGPDSRFRLCLIPWGGAWPRAVVTKDKSVVLILGGCSRGGYWKRDVINPANEACEQVLASVRQSAEEIAAKAPVVLTAGVGEHFNQERPARPAYGALLNTLVFMQFFAVYGVRRLIGYGNRLLELYCYAAFVGLETQKEQFLELQPDVLYPCPSSVFSAATLELGGPHLRATNSGHEPTTWSILVALGNFVPRLGGHIILWDLGFVVSFPPGSCILLPTGLIRYSFVKVREGKTRYSVVQFAGSGVTRWLQNGRRTDIDFSANASREQHQAHEARRELAQDALLNAFPLSSELPEDFVRVPFYGPPPQFDE
ncbi:hypothetical protein C8F04DRAFT_1187720 [Mycena alexandri]|uniref:Uncharacterized protein n=1 Tax=Mycena alexandri TaxID=1745969 RepID=A0AAD6SLS9_9AGAR|nr:hypothetical protein C8F04DRAFT_1187720 [Mycena alexandri]